MDYKALMDAKKVEDEIKESKLSLTKKIKEALELIDEGTLNQSISDTLDDLEKLDEISLLRHLIKDIKIILKR